MTKHPLTPDEPSRKAARWWGNALLIEAVLKAAPLLIALGVFVLFVLVVTFA